jgi:hypothetical protein
MKASIRYGNQDQLMGSIDGHLGERSGSFGGTSEGQRKVSDPCQVRE